MTHEFDRVRASFAASGPGRVVTGLTRGLEAAWRTSRVRAGLLSIATGTPHQWTPMLIRQIAIAIVIAAALQPLLITVMSPTVRPAMPLYVFASIGLLAAVAAWRPDAVAAAWRDSRFTRRQNR
jgi:hypothetical protein